MLDRLLGTLDPVTGTRADDGMMVHVAGARYRIRDIQSYHYTLCSLSGDHRERAVGGRRAARYARLRRSITILQWCSFPS